MLSLIVFLPAAAAVALLAVPSRAPRAAFTRHRIHKQSFLMTLLWRKLESGNREPLTGARA